MKISTENAYWLEGFRFWVDKPVGHAIMQEGTYTTKYMTWYKKQALKLGVEIEFKDGVIVKVAHYEK